MTDEYLRLERHELPTLEKKAIRFMPYRRDREDKQETPFPISHNVHSLHAHTEDIETDDLLTRPDYLALNETWMDSDSLVSVNYYSAHL